MNIDLIKELEEEIAELSRELNKSCDHCFKCKECKRLVALICELEEEQSCGDIDHDAEDNHNWNRRLFI